MKKMITAVAALLMTAATFAQTAKTTTPDSKIQPASQKQTATPEQRAKHETDQINSFVPLGASYDKVLAVNTDYVNKRLALKASAGGKDGGGPTEDQKAKMKALNDEHKKNLETAMGADTYAKYQAAMKAKREEKREMRTQPTTAPAAK